MITTVAGNGTYGYSGDNGPATAAELEDPRLAVDAYGDLFIADSGDDRIREVDLSTGVITTVAGNGTYGYGGDNGQATAAELGDPAGLAVDAYGDLFIADAGTERIREVDLATGVITTIAGNGTYGYAGDNGPATAAELFGPGALAVDGAGHLFIADTENSRVREVDLSTGVITTVVGNGTRDYGGDGSQAAATGLCPAGLVVDATGSLSLRTDNTGASAGLRRRVFPRR